MVRPPIFWFTSSAYDTRAGLGQVRSLEREPWCAPAEEDKHWGMGLEAEELGLEQSLR